MHRSIAPVVSLAIAVLLVLSTVAPANAATFRFRGHGFGHGIGMSQWGAKGLAEHGWSYPAILSHYYRGTTLGTLGYTPYSNGETVMRVAIQRFDTPQTFWTLKPKAGELWVSWEGMPAGGYLKLSAGMSYSFFVSGGNIVCRDQNGVVKKTFTGAQWVQAWERDTSSPRYSGHVQVMQASGPFDRANILYPGSIRIQKQSVSSANLYARNYVYMEDYVRCVVPRESPASWHQEALKAQSVAARSYAYVSRRPSSAFDVWCTTSSQVYNGWGQWTQSGGAARHPGDSLVDPAVSATSAQVVKYGSSVVQTFFHSTSGGHTENIENVWPGATPQPYYTGVPDYYEHAAGAAYHQWDDYTYSDTEVRNRLLSAGISSAKLPSTITGLRVSARGVSGRIMALDIYASTGWYSRLSGSTEIGRVRNALGKALDTWIYVNPKATRVYGDTRYSTATTLSRYSFPSGASNVVIANGSSYADALAASGLAGALDAPVLLTKSTSLPAEVRTEIERLGATKAYVVGGSAVVGQPVYDQLRAIPNLSASGRVESIAGVDRYDTAALIAKKIRDLRGPVSRVIVVNGTTFADAVAGAPFAYRKSVPVLLVKDNSVPAATANVVRELGSPTPLVIGGTAVVPDSVAGQLGSFTRIAAGSDRYATAAQLANYLASYEGFRWTNVHVASGTSLVDALAGGPYAGRRNGPVLFATRYALPSASSGALSSRRASVSSAAVLGGPGALNNVVQAKVEQALE